MSSVHFTTLSVPKLPDRQRSYSGDPGLSVVSELTASLQGGVGDSHFVAFVPERLGHQGTAVNEVGCVDDAGHKRAQPV